MINSSCNFYKPFTNDQNAAETVRRHPFSGIERWLGHFGRARIPTQIDYADYRDADGVKVPFRWTLARPDNRFTIQVDQLQQNVPVDDAKFSAPRPPASS